MITETDYKASKATLRFVEIEREFATKKNATASHNINVIKVLEVIDFILTRATVLLFTKDGKPKNKLQLMLSLFEIVVFIRDVIRMINSNVQYKPKTARPLTDDSHK